MNPHAKPLISPLSLCQSLYKNADLIFKLAKRDVITRYRGSMLGFAWSFFTPLFVLLVYTFFFSVVFKARFGSGPHTNGTVGFALVLFCGLIIYNFFVEVINRSPTVLTTQVSFIKKIIFPLEVLPVVNVVSAVFPAAVSLLALFAGFIFLHGTLHWTILWFPLVFVPLVLFCMGFSWMLSSVGVYLVDVKHVVALISMVLMFVTPIFYPISALPARLQPLTYFNPLTIIVQQSRAVLLLGQNPDWTLMAFSVVGSMLVAWLGYICFQKARRGFSDVV